MSRHIYQYRWFTFALFFQWLQCLFGWSSRKNCCWLKIIKNWFIRSGQSYKTFLKELSLDQLILCQNKSVIIYANDVAKDIINVNNISENELSNVQINIIESMEMHVQKFTSFQNFLQNQESKFKDEKVKISEQLVELKQKFDSFEDLKQSYENSLNEISLWYYNIKTLKVNWENNHNSFLHVFIDTSQIK